MAQPFGRSPDIKATTPLTLAAIADRLVALGLASAEEVAWPARDLDADFARPETSMGDPVLRGVGSRALTEAGGA